MQIFAHPAEVTRIYEKILEKSSAEERYIDISEGRRIHVIEAGTGTPLIMLHGTGAPAHTMLPILEHLDGIHAIVPDLPGSGLSDPVDIVHRSYREMAVDVLEKILDTLSVDRISIAGSSGGGVWGIWYALARPERVQRLVLIGSTPLLPGTSAPVPLRIMVTPIIGDLISRRRVDETMIVELLEVMGEKETIVNYPMMIEALAAGNNDPIASGASRREYSAFINPFGFRPNMIIGPDELGRLKMPVLMIWGKNDPLGGADVARAASEMIPDCGLELLPTGHVPWLGFPEETANRISEFVH